METISDVIGQEYKKWKIGDLILITGGTGTGKSFFVQNTLDAYCLNYGKNILYLSNRDILKEQVRNGLDILTSITVENYQKAEEMLLRNEWFCDCDYVICDEAQYFFTDASFNNKTNLVFRKILRDDKIIKVLMTATPIILENYFKHNGIDVKYKYELPTDYSYISKIITFNTYESMHSIIEGIPQDEQIMLFSSAKRAYDVAKKYNGAFICSQQNKDGYYKYVDKDELSNIIENGEFKNRLLCCTTALDNGVNIKEYSKAKHIIIDILDRDTFLQVLGRKRIGEGETISLYFYNYKDKQRINGFKRKIVNSLEMADFLIKHGEKEFVMKNFKSVRYADTRVIDEIVIDGKIHKIVNECMYAKYKADIILYDYILKSKSPNTYKNMIALQLRVEATDILEIEEAKAKSDLEDYLESIVGEKLYKPEQNELAKIADIKHNRKLMKSAESLNAGFKEIGLRYKIISNKDNRRVLEDGSKNGNRGKFYWEVVKVIEG
jgi:hypothetical protein